MRANITIYTFLLLLFSSCGTRERKTNQKPVEIPTVTVERKDLQYDHLYVSNIQAIRNVEMRSKVSGFLEGIYVDEGETVKKGQVLFRIGDSEYENEVAKARAMLSMAEADKKTAQVEQQRVKILVDKKIVSNTELDLATSRLNAATSKVAEASSTLEIALHRLSYTVIRAPFDGEVDRIPLKAGSLVAEGTLMTSVSDISAMYAYFNISENEYLSYERAKKTRSAEEHNRSVCLILSDGKEYACKGTVETVVSEFDGSTGSIAFRARFPNPDRLLKHNATGKIKLTTNMDAALVVPQKSVFEIQDKSFVYAVDKQDVVKMKHVETGDRINKYFVVRSGLEEGEVIVYEGIQNIKDGMKVKPLKALESAPAVTTLVR